MAKQLTLFLEGDRDNILFTRRIKNFFEDKGFDVEITEYREDTKKFVNAYIETLNQFPESKTYIFIADLDRCSNDEEKKLEVLKTYSSADISKIFVICKMIEGWYLGGLDKESAESIPLNISFYDRLNPNTVKKNQFLKLRPNGMKKRSFYLLIANYFSISSAKKRNISYNNFHSKYLA
jgi:hypothetical protein